MNFNKPIPTSLHNTAKCSLWATSESYSKVRFHFMFSSGITRFSARVCSKSSKCVQLKLREIAVKRLKKPDSPSAIASGDSYASFVLSNLPHASITQ